MIRIITDSTSDISVEAAKKLGIDILSLPVFFGETCYKNSAELSNEDFYKKLATVKKLPTTSQVNPGEFKELFLKYTQQGDEVLAILLSSDLSGTYQSAIIAKEEIGSDKITVIDSRSVTTGLNLLILEAAKMRDAGKSVADITDVLESLIPRVRIWAVVDTLKYLKMGGRISATSAVVGSVIGISPIVGIVDGKVESVGKKRGRKNSLRKVKDFMEEHEPDTQYTIGFVHSNAEDALAECMEIFMPQLNTENYITINIGSVVGTHAGPGATGICYIAKEK